MEALASAPHLATGEATRERLVLRPLLVSDRAAVQSLLRRLPEDYPEGDRWLSRRLTDVSQGQASCTLAELGGRTVGVTIVTPKWRARKLSTIFVEPAARRLGVGSALFDAVIAAAAQTRRETGESDEIYVTVAHHNWHLLRSLLVSRGFITTALEMDRYGRGRHEVVATRLSTVHQPSELSY